MDLLVTFWYLLLGQNCLSFGKLSGKRPEFMNDKDSKMEDEIKAHRFNEGSEKHPVSQRPILTFFTDFLTGFGTLFLIGIILFIVIPLLLITLKIGVALAIPIAVLGACIILIALFGKFIKFLIKKS